jgi:hypothetical protein
MPNTKNEQWRKAQKGNPLHGTVAMGRGKVAFQPIFSHLLQADICFRFK